MSDERSASAASRVERRLAASLRCSAFGFLLAVAVLPAIGLLVGQVDQVDRDVAIGLLVALVTCLWAFLVGTAWMTARLGAGPGPSVLTERVNRVLDPLIAKAGIHRPRVWVLPSPSPNAFAATALGRPVIGVTSGLLDRLDDDELAGALGHEVGHLMHGDGLYLGWFVAVVSLLTVLTVVCVSVSLALAASGGRRRRRKDDVSAALALVGLVGFFASLVIGTTGVIIARLAALASLRQREYAADTRSALLTGHPLWLASALRRMDRGLPEPVANRSPVAALFTVPATAQSSWWDRIFATHPPTRDRIARLESLAAELPAADRPARPPVGMGEVGTRGVRPLPAAAAMKAGRIESLSPEAARIWGAASFTVERLQADLATIRALMPGWAGPMEECIVVATTTRDAAEAVARAGHAEDACALLQRTFTYFPGNYPIHLVARYAATSSRPGKVRRWGSLGHEYLREIRAVNQRLRAILVAIGAWRGA
jgi:heat shock protein HtpX